MQTPMRLRLGAGSVALGGAGDVAQQRQTTVPGLGFAERVAP
jgi:hypothetical protein